MNIALTQLKAMLQEITASAYRDTRNTQAIMSIGTAEQPDWERLSRLSELADIVLATKQALPVMHEGKISVDNPTWNEFENVYYNRVIRPVFAGL